MIDMIQLHKMFETSSTLVMFRFDIVDFDRGDVNRFGMPTYTDARQGERCQGQHVEKTFLNQSVQTISEEGHYLLSNSRE